MGKWIAGIVGSVLVGALLWILTNRYLPHWFEEPPAVADSKLRVECSANPATVSPGQSTEITIKVMLNGEPLEGVEVKVAAGGGRFGSAGTETSGNTYSGGVFRTIWTAPAPSAGAYVVGVHVTGVDDVSLDDAIRTSGFHTQCHLLVR